jgi:hypothetical protein
MKGPIWERPEAERHRRGLAGFSWWIARWVVRGEWGSIVLR